MTRTAPAILGAVMMLFACSKQPDTATQPVPSPTPRARLLPPAPPGGTAKTRLPAPELDATGVTPGAWRLQASATGSAAIFGDAVFAIRCDPAAQQLVFAIGKPAPTLRIVTDTGAASYATTTRDGETTAATGVSDTFLTDVLAPATVRIGITTNGDTIVVPPDKAIVDVIRSCRRAAGLMAPR